jgi:hypothetical protein
VQGNHGRSNSARAHPSHSSLSLSNRRRAIKLPNWGYSHLLGPPGHTSRYRDGSGAELQENEEGSHTDRWCSFSSAGEIVASVFTRAAGEAR